MMLLSEVALRVLAGLVALLCTSYGCFITNTLAKIDKNQTRLFDAVTALATGLAKLQGEHEAAIRFQRG
jgi:tRNA G26 N,N-dimethylase Trm1